MLNPLTIDPTSMVVMQAYRSDPVKIMDLLAKLGASGIRMTNNAIRSSCPVHRGDNQYAFSVWFDQELPIWKCYSQCGRGGLLPQLVMKTMACSYRQAIAYLGSHVGISVSQDANVITIPQDQMEVMNLSALDRALGLNNSNQLNVFPEGMIKQSTVQMHPFFLDRGYSMEVLQYFEVGFVPGNTWMWTCPTDLAKLEGWFDDRISIPWRDMHRRLIGFAGRRVDNHTFKKYIFLPGTKRSLTLYGMDKPEVVDAIKRSKKIHLVEGYPDMWRAIQHDQWNFSVVGGTEMSPQQIGLLQSMEIETIVTYFDGDQAGQTVALRLQKQLSRICRVYNAKPPNKKDPGDLEVRNEFTEPLRKAVLVG